jgi:hypothetical protein
LLTAFHFNASTLVFTPDAGRPTLDTGSFTVDAYPLRACTNYAGAPGGIHTEYTMSTSGAVTYSFNTMPTFAFSSDIDRIAYALTPTALSPAYAIPAMAILAFPGAVSFIAIWIPPSILWLSIERAPNAGISRGRRPAAEYRS